MSPENLIEPYFRRRIIQGQTSSIKAVVSDARGEDITIERLAD